MNVALKKPVAFTIAVAVVAAVGLWVASRFVGKENPQIATPILALESLTAKSLFFNAAAHPWLLAQRPELLSGADAERIRGMVQAVQNPKLFRQLDRQWRFDALLLVGDPSQYRPLLEHLLESGDWKLAYLDHTSLVFRRGAETAWSPSDLGAVRQRFAGAAKRDQAKFLAQAGTKLLAVRLPALAKQCLEEAVQLDAKCADGWNGLAIFRMGRGEFREALEHADHALEIDDDFAPALATKTQILFSTKHFSEAFDISRKLVAKHPADPGLLFYHAKIAHQASAFGSEIDALEKLIALAKRESRPTSGYEVYLGQAYAAKGDAEPSIEHFARALADPELETEQRKFAQDSLTRIKGRTGAK